MTVNITYFDNYSRGIPAILIDARATIPAIKEKSADVVKAYVGSQVGAVGDTTPAFRLETNEGVLAGYFVLSIKGQSAEIIQFVLRPAFQEFTQEISTQIANFTNNQSYLKDVLIAN